MAIENHRDRSSELHLKVSVGSEVDFGVDLLKKLGIVGEILDKELWQRQKINWKRLSRKLNSSL